MERTKERLSFLLQFIKMDLDRLFPAAWRKLKLDISLFLSSNFDNRVQVDSQQKAFTEQEIKKTQDDVKVFFDMLFKEESGVHLTASVPLSGMFQLRKEASACILGIEGEPREMFLLILYLLFIQGADDCLRSCPACGKIFIRARKQIYCGRRCKKLINMREWRMVNNGKKSGN